MKFRTVFLIFAAVMTGSAPTHAQVGHGEGIPNLGAVDLPQLQEVRSLDVPPNAYNASLGRMIIGATPTALAWSPDGKKLAAFSAYGQNLTVWDGTGKIIALVHPDLNYIFNSLEFLSDNEIVTPPGNSRTDPASQHLAFDIWNIQTGAVVKRVDGPEPNKDFGSNLPNEYALSSDRTLAIAIAQNTGLPKYRADFAPSNEFDQNPLPIYSTKSWEIVQKLRVLSPLSIAFSPDGHQVAFGTYQGTIQVYNTVTWRLTNTISVCGGTGFAVTIAYSPDGKFIVAGLNGNNHKECIKYAAQIFRISDGTLMATYEDVLAGSPWKILWHSSGRFIVFATHHQGLRLWSPSQPLQMKTIPNVNSTCLALSPDGKQLAACNDDRISLFNISF